MPPQACLRPGPKWGADLMDPSQRAHLVAHPCGTASLAYPQPVSKDAATQVFEVELEPLPAPMPLSPTLATSGSSGTTTL